MTNKKDKVTNQLNFNFLTNNVRGMLSTKKLVKMFEYLKSKIGPKRYFISTRNSFFD